MPERKSHGRSKAGVELTDEVLERMADEAEEGLDVTKLRRRPGRPAMGSAPAESFPVRLEPELRRALDERAAADDTPASEVVRGGRRRAMNVSGSPRARWLSAGGAGEERGDDVDTSRRWVVKQRPWWVVLGLLARRRFRPRFGC
jgi:CRISPR-associated endonuclease/helicase Cas3